MLSSVLNSERAVKVNIEIMRAFVRLRQMLASNADLARKLDALEKKYDAQFRVVFDAIRELMKPPAPPAPEDRVSGEGAAGNVWAIKPLRNRKGDASLTPCGRGPLFPLSPTRERARVRGIDWPCVTPFVTGAW